MFWFGLLVGFVVVVVVWNCVVGLLCYSPVCCCLGVWAFVNLLFIVAAVCCVLRFVMLYVFVLGVFAVWMLILFSGWGDA